MIARGLIYLSLLATALVAIGVQLDRQVMLSPGMALSVPPPFRAEAEEALARNAAAQQSRDTLALARELVRRRPVPAEHLLLVAVGARANGDTASMIEPLELAARRGWREPGVQIVAAEAALQVQDYTSAAQRVAALFATAAAPDQANAYLARLIETEGGRTALADLLPEEGYWQRPVLRRLQISGNPAQVADLLSRTDEMDCSLIGEFADRYERAGEVGAAETIRSLPCRKQ